MFFSMHYSHVGLSFILYKLKKIRQPIFACKDVQTKTRSFPSRASSSQWSSPGEPLGRLLVLQLSTAWTVEHFAKCFMSRRMKFHPEWQHDVEADNSWDDDDTNLTPVSFYHVLYLAARHCLPTLSFPGDLYAHNLCLHATFYVHNVTSVSSRKSEC